MRTIFALAFILGAALADEDFRLVPEVSKVPALRARSHISETYEPPSITYAPPVVTYPPVRVQTVYAPPPPPPPPAPPKPVYAPPPPPPAPPKPVYAPPPPPPAPPKPVYAPPPPPPAPKPVYAPPAVPALVYGVPVAHGGSHEIKTGVVGIGGPPHFDLTIVSDNIKRGVHHSRSFVGHPGPFKHGTFKYVDPVGTPVHVKWI